MSQEDLDSDLVEGVETFGTISSIDFLKEYDLPKIDYDGPEDLNPAWAARVASDNRGLDFTDRQNTDISCRTV